MQWQVWVIPLFALAVFILSQLASRQQQQQRTRPPLPRDSQEDAAPPPRRGSRDLEDFLDEIKRRKRGEEM